MNFRVTCTDSSFTQRASGANPLTPSTNRPIRWRMASSMSSAIKSLTEVLLPSNVSDQVAGELGVRPAGRDAHPSTGSPLSANPLHQLPSYHVERHLRGEPAHALAVSWKLALLHLRAVLCG